MASTGAAKAKYPSEATIKVSHGCPDPATVTVSTQATVQFVNEDTGDYRVRLWTRWVPARHADVDILLPGRSGITVMVDPETKKQGECRYELIPTSLVGHSMASVPVPAPKVPRAAAKTSGATKTAAHTATTHSGGGGGTIKIGPVG